MKFDKLIQIMENRGVEMPTPDVSPLPVDNSLENQVKKDIKLLRNHTYFEKQFRNIKSNFLGYKKALNDLKKSYKGKDMGSDRKRLEKQKLNFENAIDALKSDRKGKAKIVNNFNLSNGEKEELERELRKLETELKIVKEQLRTRPHDKEILKLVLKFEKIVDKIENSPPKTTEATKEKMLADLRDIRFKLSIPKYYKADTLLTKIVKDYPRFSKMKTKFANANSKPALVKHSKSDIFDLDKTIKKKEREYNKVVTALSELENLENTINSDIEGFNSRAIDQLKTLVQFTGDMMTKDSGKLKDDQLSQLGNISTGDNSIAKLIDALTRQYNTYNDENPSKVRNFGMLPFNGIIKVFNGGNIGKLAAFEDEEYWDIIKRREEESKPGRKKAPETRTMSIHKKMKKPVKAVDPTPRYVRPISPLLDIEEY